MIDNQSDISIGGYPCLELPFFDANLAQATVRTNSARSAIRVVLSAVNARKLWLPTYICDAVFDAVKDLEITVEFYTISPTFDVATDVCLGKDEYILVVNYFGVADSSVKRSLNKFGRSNTIVDCSQAYFAPHAGGLGTVWSPRKFFGLPDGGLLVSDDPRIKQPKHRDDTSETRMAHLVSRLANSPETSYQKYLEAEQSIAELPVLSMSRLTERLLHSVDYGAARAVRSRNARYLHDRLGKYNQLDLSFDENTAPLCYPFLPKGKTASRSDMIRSRVFVPSYWPEVLTRTAEGSFEWGLVSNGLFLPCDQRCTVEDMHRLVSLLAVK